MNDFDKYIKRKAQSEKTELPDSAKNKIEQALAGLPEKKGKTVKYRVFPKIAAAAACFVFITVFLLPNVSVAYAQTLEQIPVLGDIIHVVTIRNYFYSDERHEMDIDVPKVEGEDGSAADYINKDINELTSALVKQFYNDLEIVGNNGYGSIYVDYETVTNTDRWFTLKLSVSETAGSGNTYFKYYHIDKRNGKIIKLGDLFNTNDFSDILTAEIKKQMKQIMKEDPDAAFWVGGPEIGIDFTAVDAGHNFYWNERGDLVIVFDKYEAAPGSMGTPEFAVSKEVIKDILKPEYVDIAAE